jgi:hypothetical protein
MQEVPALRIRLIDIETLLFCLEESCSQPFQINFSDKIEEEIHRDREGQWMSNFLPFHIIFFGIHKAAERIVAAREEEGTGGTDRTGGTEGTRSFFF